MLRCNRHIPATEWPLLVAVQPSHTSHRAATPCCGETVTYQPPSGHSLLRCNRHIPATEWPLLAAVQPPHTSHRVATPCCGATVTYQPPSGHSLLRYACLRHFHDPGYCIVHFCVSANPACAFLIEIKCIKRHCYLIFKLNFNTSNLLHAL